MPGLGKPCPSTGMTAFLSIFPYCLFLRPLRNSPPGRYPPLNIQRGEPKIPDSSPAYQNYTPNRANEAFSRVSDRHPISPKPEGLANKPISSSHAERLGNRLVPTSSLRSTPGHDSSFAHQALAPPQWSSAPPKKDTKRDEDDYRPPPSGRPPSLQQTAITSFTSGTKTSPPRASHLGSFSFHFRLSLLYINIYLN